MVIDTTLSTNQKRYLVILDAGHGLDTDGKETALFPDGTRMKENEFNRSVVRKIDSILEQYNVIDIYFTVTEKRDIDKDTKTLDERVRRANDIYNRYKHKYEKVVLISVHANALTGEWGTQNGTSTHYYPTNEVDKTFAEIINKHLIAKTELKNRGNVGSNFQILREPLMTACLCECAFMDNLTEAKLLLTDDFRLKCAEGIVDGLLEYFKIEKINPIKEEVIEIPVKEKVIYTVTPNKTHQLCGNVKDFGSKIVNKSNRSIEEPNVTNGSFFWYLDTKKTQTYSTSIFIQNGKIIQGTANHYYDFGCPQNVFIIYNDNRIEMKKVYFANQLDYQNIKFAMGGIGLRDTTNANFKYDPASEGFKWGYNKQTKSYVSYADVLRKTNKIVMGYNIAEDKLYLMVRPNIEHSSAISYDLLDLVKDCKYDIAISFDGGGSVFLNNETDMVFYGDGRRIYSIIGWNLN